MSYAASKGHPAMVRALLAIGADPNVQNVDGDTPLHLAIAQRHAQLVPLFIDAGVDVRIENKRGFDAHEYARIRQAVEIMAMIEGAGGGPEQ